VTYLWGTTGIGYNEAKIKQVLGEGVIPDSWNYIFDPALAAKFKDCGISVLDSPDEILKVTLVWMGRDPNSQKEEDLKAAEEKLMAVRPFIRKIHSSQYIEDLANGDLCVAVGWSGDILQARDRKRLRRRRLLAFDHQQVLALLHHFAALVGQFNIER
jgi:putrescine transport system substrate-binding protein